MESEIHVSKKKGAFPSFQLSKWGKSMPAMVTQVIHHLLLQILQILQIPYQDQETDRNLNHNPVPP